MLPSMGHPSPRSKPETSSAFEQVLAIKSPRTEASLHEDWRSQSPTSLQLLQQLTKREGKHGTAYESDGDEKPDSSAPTASVAQTRDEGAVPASPLDAIKGNIGGIRSRVMLLASSMVKQGSMSSGSPYRSPMTSYLLALLLTVMIALMVFSRSLTGVYSNDADSRYISVVDEGRQPLLILITPTYVRPFQAVYITNVVNVLRSVPPPVLWLVMEAGNKTEETATLLQRSAGYCSQRHRGSCPDVPYIHMGVKPKDWKDNTGLFRGISQRNLALDYISERRLDGIVYFMDDDNAYSIQAFEELRKIERVGLLPVGFVYPKGALPNMVNSISRPMLRINGSKATIAGWEQNGRHLPLKAQSTVKDSRKYAVDMAGFGFKSSLLWEESDPITGKPEHPVRFTARKKGYLETDFVDRLVSSENDLELLADFCRDVWVWHRHAEAAAHAPFPHGWRDAQLSERPRPLHKPGIRWRKKRLERQQQQLLQQQNETAAVVQSPAARAALKAVAAVKKSEVAAIIKTELDAVKKTEVAAVEETGVATNSSLPSGGHALKQKVKGGGGRLSSEKKGASETAEGKATKLTMDASDMPSEAVTKVNLVKSPKMKQKKGGTEDSEISYTKTLKELRKGSS